MGTFPQSGTNQDFKCFRPCWTFIHTFGKVGKKLFSEVEDTLEVIYVIGVFSLWKQLFPKVSKSVWKCSRGVLKWLKHLFKVFLAVLDLLQHFWTVFEVFGSWAVTCYRTMSGTDHGLKIHLQKILADRPEFFLVIPQHVLVWTALQHTFKLLVYLHFIGANRTGLWPSFRLNGGS